MITTSFQQWLEQRGYDQQRWNPELLRSLKARFERENPARIVIDGRSADWPTRTYRVEPKL
jgi:hypothetical protein